MTEDHRHLARAIELARLSREGGDPPFASVLVDAEGETLAEETSTIFRDNDITAHAETKIVRWAAANLSPEARATATLYSCVRPCSMCSGAIERSGLRRVVFALSAEQMRELMPAPPGPDVVYEGPVPELFADAVEAVLGPR